MVPVELRPGLLSPCPSRRPALRLSFVDHRLAFSVRSGHIIPPLKMKEKDANLKRPEFKNEPRIEIPIVRIKTKSWRLTH
jgi:hypothetical protein